MLCPLCRAPNSIGIFELATFGNLFAESHHQKGLLIGLQPVAMLQVQYGQRDVSANKLRKYLRTFTAPKTLEGPLKVLPSFPVEMRDVLLHSVSPSGKTRHSAFFCKPLIL